MSLRRRAAERAVEQVADELLLRVVLSGGGAVDVGAVGSSRRTSTLCRS